MKYYDVFRAGDNGGKRFAVVTDVIPESVMPEIALSSQAPITAFVSPEPRKKQCTVRFFTRAGTEKLESDSGALVVAHFLGSSCLVQMQNGNLAVTLEDGYAWTSQPDTHILPLPSPETPWLEALGLQTSDLEPELTMLCAGTLEKHNLIVPTREHSLNFTPDFAALSNLLKQYQFNGCIAVCFTSSRANLEYRFFAPHKGLLEDNAGSFSLASICGYKAAHTPSGMHDVIAAQGYTMNKPSELRARFITRDSTALAMRVGGIVTEVV